MDWRCILFIVKCLEAYYPESLNVMLIHNAPWVFQGIWKLLGPMLDPVVRNKIAMTKSIDDLVVHVPRKHLVKELGESGGYSRRWIDTKSHSSGGDWTCVEPTRGARVSADRPCFRCSSCRRPERVEVGVPPNCSGGKCLTEVRLPPDLEVCPPLTLSTPSLVTTRAER